MRKHILHIIKCESVVVLQNNIKIYLDLTLLMDKMVHFNQPDLTLVYKTNKEAAFIDMSIPLTYSLQTTISEVQRKY